MRKIKKQYSPLINMILYALLLIATPFLLLQNYLQTSIGKLSELFFEVSGFKIPYVVVFALMLAIVLIIKNLKHLTRYRIISILITFFLIFIGQKLSDFYFNHKFYELQYNWHYFAYGIFSFIAYRYFKSKNKPNAMIIFLTFISAISISTFDEFIQIYISNRIFDIGDIGKDVWGTIIGMFFIFFVINEGEIIKHGWKLREKKIKDYFNNSFSILFLGTILTLILLFTSSILTDMEYLTLAIIISIGIFFIFFLIFHLSQRNFFKRIFIVVAIFYFLVQGVFFLKYHNNNIIRNSYGITVYKGIPLLFFDIMIYENGFFRLVDKKHFFNKRDINTICNYTNDILLIGSGQYGKGGNGFPEKMITQFIFNSVNMKPLQVIILDTPEACKKYNQLKKEGYNVLFIIHNTC
ncbi:MAG: VanZ family protein [Candidatus Cloacimonetes bacterium]|nr:VanZ family protein [Candidatus Cloacimonadota bacterium]